MAYFFEPSRSIPLPVPSPTVVSDPRRPRHRLRDRRAAVVITGGAGFLGYHLALEIVRYFIEQLFFSVDGYYLLSSINAHYRYIFFYICGKTITFFFPRRDPTAEAILFDLRAPPRDWTEAFLQKKDISPEERRARAEAVDRIRFFQGSVCSFEELE